MGITKTEIFTEEQNKIASLAKVLGHPARVAILQYLIKRTTCICGDLVEEIGLAQPTISQHLKELKEAGLITGDISGKKICYCIDAQAWKQAQQMLHVLFSDFRPCDTSAELLLHDRRRRWPKRALVAYRVASREFE